MTTAVTPTNVNQLTVTEIVDSLIPNMEAALSQATDAPEANEIRHRIGVVADYLKRHIPGEIKERKRRLRVANKANRVYLDACRKAGAYWDIAEKHAGRPPESVTNRTLLTAEQAGFASRKDAQRCVRAANVDDEDYRVWQEQCDLYQRQYTLHGLVQLFAMLNGDEVVLTIDDMLERVKGNLEDLLIMASDDPIYPHVYDAYTAIVTAQNSV